MIQKFVYKRATMEDIDELVRTRIIVLRAANKLPDDEDMSVVEKESYAYYRRALETGEHIAYLVYDNGAFVGAGGVSFYQVMPTYHNPNGKNVMICSVAVLPQYQGRGIAREMVRELLLEQRKLGKKCAILTCVPGKVKMYKKFGFMDRGESQSTWGGEKWHEMWCTLNS